MLALPSRQTLLESCIAQLREGLVGAASSESAGFKVPGSERDWRGWVSTHFPHVCSKPFSPRHEGLWGWFEALTPGVKPRPRVEVWPRGGAKSSTGELGTCYVGCRLSRRFVLYVSETQEQADKHVQAIATLFERLNVDRLVGKYGTSKGWRRDQLRTANGFNVAAYGLDAAARGVKLDEFRPDLIVFDDIDRQDDTPETVNKKIAAITTSLLPAGASDCAVLFLQNLIHEDGILSQLVDGRADFLHNREIPTVEPAVVGLRVELEEQPDGSKLYRITGGQATWEGQDLATCEGQINEWGLGAFKREAQHEVQGANGYFFDHEAFEVVDSVPKDTKLTLKLCRAWDLAATEGGGDYTVGVLMGVTTDTAQPITYVLEMWREQWGSDKVRQLVLKGAEHDFSRFGQRCSIHLPQDPGQAGKSQATQFRDQLSEQAREKKQGYNVRIRSVSGSKPVRARGWQEQVNRGNVRLVKGEWNRAFVEEHRKFREDLTHENDDIVDACADAHNILIPKQVATRTSHIRTNS